MTTGRGGRPVRRLLVLRHGHAEQHAPAGGGDIDRRLRPKGVRSVQALHAVVDAADVDRVFCSTAVRTRETLAALELLAPVTFAASLYGADADEWVEAVRETEEIHPDGYTVLLVGHNPAMHQLVLELTGGERVPGFPPASLAVLELDVDAWWKVGPGCARLVRLHLPADPAE